MPASIRIAVVSADAQQRSELEAWLAGDGRDVLALDGFHAARRALDVCAADLVVADVRLAEYNGLHVAMRARWSGTGTPAIVIGDPDPVLQADAACQGTTYLTRPLQREVLLAAVRSAIDAHRPTRRSPRKRVDRVAALVNGQDASLVELSYEGLRVEIPRPAMVPTFFTITVPGFQVACRAQRVWEAADPGSDALWCGAELATHDPEATSAWRQFVDAVAGWTVSAN